MTEPLDVKATRAAYDGVAVSYEELLRNLMAEKVYDRAILSAFAERVAGTGNLKVLDVGCGPGRIAAHLASLGLDAGGMDLSPEMVAVAQKTHPAINFAEGDLETLDAGAGELGGIVAWYSLIHTPPERLPRRFASLNSALAAGGFLLLAFQAGTAKRQIERAYGHEVTMDAYLMAPERTIELLQDAGFTVEAQLVRAPDSDERTPQAYLMVQKR